jgi:hypothetical protein
METMRAWLDSGGYAAKRFDCRKAENVVIVALDSVVHGEGEAFAARFGKNSLLRPPLGMD